MPNYFGVIKRKCDVRGQTFKFGAADTSHAVKMLLKMGGANSVFEVAEYEVMKVTDDKKYIVVASLLPEIPEAAPPAEVLLLSEAVYPIYAVAIA